MSARLSGPAREPLPVFAIVAAAYRYVWAELPALLRLSAPWLAAGLALFAGGAVLGLYRFETAAMLEGLLDWLGYAAVAVAWLRHLVLGEPWPAFGAPPGAPAVRYLLWSVVLGVCASLPVGVASLLAAAAPALWIPLLGAGVLAAVAIAVHLLFVPVGAALDERPSFAQSAALVRGHAIRIVVGFVSAILPLGIAGALAAVAVGNLFGAGDPDAPGGPGLLVADLVVRLVHYADAAVTSTFLAGIHSRLVREAGSATGT